MVTLRSLFSALARAVLDTPLVTPPTADERAAELEAGEALDREEWDAWATRYDRTGTERRTATGWLSRTNEWTK